MLCLVCVCFFFSSRRRHTRCALVTGVQTCALPISRDVADRARHLLSAWRATDSGVALAVRVTPRASRDGWGKHDPEHFGVRIAAPPVEDAANARLIAFIAKAFKVAKRDVTLIGGDTGRLKRLTIAGDPDTLAGIAASLYGAQA